MAKSEKIVVRQPIFAGTNVGKVRQRNEDALGIADGYDKQPCYVGSDNASRERFTVARKCPNGDLYIVCDGMGGHAGGQMASKLAVEKIVEYMRQERFDIRTALKAALRFANHHILGYAAENPEYKGMGTTACIVLVQPDAVYIAHIGDSRIYLYLGKEKKLRRITKDHSWVQAMVDSNQMSEAEAEKHPNKNIILKALGVKPDIEPTVEYVAPKRNDVFIICSDGLSGMVDDATMEVMLSQDKDAEEIGKELIRAALDNGGKDNVTVELIQIAKSPYNESIYPYKGAKKQAVKKNGVKKSGKKPAKRLNWRNIFIAVLVLVVIGVACVFVFDVPVFGKKEAQNINIANDDVINQLDKNIKEADSLLNEAIKQNNPADSTKYAEIIKYCDSLLNKRKEELINLHK